MFKKHVQQVARSKWDNVQAEGKSAQELLASDSFAFFMSFLKETQSYITESIIENKIKKVEEHHLIDQVFKKVFHISKEEQITEASGKYLMVNEIFEFLNNRIKRMNDWNKLYDLKRLEIIDDKRL